MITMLGSPRRCCDGMTRRETLKAGALSLLGGAFNLPSLLAAEARTARRRPAGQGEERHPALPAGRRRHAGHVRPQAGCAGRHPQRVQADRHQRARHSHLRASAADGASGCTRRPSCARSTTRPAATTACQLHRLRGRCMPDQHPRDTRSAEHGFGVRVSQARRHGDFPAYVYMPCWLGWGQAFRRAGPYGGFLGKRYDPLITRMRAVSTTKGASRCAGLSAPSCAAQPFLPTTALPAGLTIDRLEHAAAACCSRSTTRCASAEPQPARATLQPDAAAGVRPADLVAAACRLRSRRTKTRGCSTAMAGRCSATAR